MKTRRVQPNLKKETRRKPEKLTGNVYTDDPVVHPEYNPDFEPEETTALETEAEVKPSDEPTIEP